MKEIFIKDSILRASAEQGIDEFLQVFIDVINNSIGSELNAETMGELNTDQITLLAYSIVREEVMDGGFIQLIHNGYGGFIFKNPFAKVIKKWGLRDLSKLIYNVAPMYNLYHEELEKECTDEEFMALFEAYPKFDDFDDQFVENEEEWTNAIAHYVDEHIDSFATLIND